MISNYFQYLLVVDCPVTVTYTGICKSPLTHKYQPLLSVFSPLIVTVETLEALVSMVTSVPSIDPDDPVTQELPSLHHFISPEV